MIKRRTVQLSSSLSLRQEQCVNSIMIQQCFHRIGFCYFCYVLEHIKVCMTATLFPPELYKVNKASNSDSNHGNDDTLNSHDEVNAGQYSRVPVQRGIISSVRMRRRNSAELVIT